MSRTRQVVRNTSILFVTQIISYILIFFYTIYIARFLGAVGFGILSFALAFSGIFSIFADLGLNTLTVRDVSRDRTLEKKYIGNGLIIKFILASLSFGLIALWVNLLGYPYETIIVVYFVSLSVILTSITGIFYSIFQSYEKMEYQSISQIINSIAMFLGVILAINFGLNLIGFSLLFFITSMSTMIFTLILFIWKFSVPKIEIDLEFWKSTIREAFPYGLAAVFVMIYYWIDSIMLSLIVGNEVVGWYNAAYRIIFIFLSFQTIFIISIFPVMSSFYNKSNSLKFAFERSFKYLLILSIPIAIFTTLMAKPIILLIFGPSYIPSIVALQILIWSIIFLFVNGLAGNLLGSVNKQSIVTKITGLGAISNILLNVILIPKFSYLGASLATVITEVIIMPILIYFIWKNGFTTLKPLSKDLHKIFFSCGLMTIFVVALNGMNLFLLIVIALIVYLGMIYITKTLDDRDFLILKNIRKKHN